MTKDDRDGVIHQRRRPTRPLARARMRRLHGSCIGGTCHMTPGVLITRNKTVKLLRVELYLSFRTALCHRSPKSSWLLISRSRFEPWCAHQAFQRLSSAIAAKAISGGVLVSALITSAATAKRIQSTMKLGMAFLDVDFAIPPRVNMKFVSLKANERTKLHVT